MLRASKAALQSLAGSDRWVSTEASLPTSSLARSPAHPALLRRVPLFHSAVRLPEDRMNFTLCEIHRWNMYVYIYHGIMIIPPQLELRIPQHYQQHKPDKSVVARPTKASLKDVRLAAMCVKGANTFGRQL